MLAKSMKSPWLTQAPPRYSSCSYSRLFAWTTPHAPLIIAQSPFCGDSAGKCFSTTKYTITSENSHHPHSREGFMYHLPPKRVVASLSNQSAKPSLHTNKMQNVRSIEYDIAPARWELADTMIQMQINTVNQ